MIHKKVINGIQIYGFSNRKDLIDFASEHKKSLIAVNAEKIFNATDEMRSLINRNIGYPDGAGAVWALRKKGLKTSLKIPVCELWLDLVKHLAKSKSFYFVGGTEEVLKKTLARVEQEFPDINIRGARNGYFKSEADILTLVNDIEVTKPDVVFVAIGSPKQEILIDKLQKIHPAIYQGLGGSFDVYVGKVKRAPEFMIKNNLEWAYRLIMQPSRIKRQKYLMAFMIHLVLNKY